MDYRMFGSTGLQVSALCLGCMTFGDPHRGSHAWTLPEEDSRPLIKQALELGINFFDTANVYSDGSSEEIVGRALKDFTRREEVVLATKVRGRMRPGPNGDGLSRKAILAEIDASLTRLGTDYVDLYQVHHWDAATPIEETLEALHDVVRVGKARYVGASNMPAWRFAKAIYTARLNGWTTFVSIQNHFNLIYREEEREMLPLCRDLGIAVLPWSPLARGRLARPLDQTTYRTETDEFGKTLYAKGDRAVLDVVGRIAEARGVPRACVALAWIRQRPGITAPVVGASKSGHLTDAVAALTLKLGDDEIAALEAPYEPRRVGADMP